MLWANLLSSVITLLVTKSKLYPFQELNHPPLKATNYDSKAKSTCWLLLYPSWTWSFLQVKKVSCQRNSCQLASSLPTKALRFILPPYLSVWPVSYLQHREDAVYFTLKESQNDIFIKPSTNLDPVPSQPCRCVRVVGRVQYLLPVSVPGQCTVFLAKTNENIVDCVFLEIIGFFGSNTHTLDNEWICICSNVREQCVHVCTLLQWVPVHRWVSDASKCLRLTTVLGWCLLPFRMSTQRNNTSMCVSETVLA